jgi:hypothetical protein
VRRLPQVLDAVIQGVAVYVIDLTHRPPTVAVKPREPMSLKIATLMINLQTGVVAVLAPHNKTLGVSENACGRIVEEFSEKTTNVEVRIFYRHLRLVARRKRGGKCGPKT